MDQKRILQLAVEALEIQKAGIDAEIESLRSELGGTGAGITMEAEPVVIPIGKKPARMLAENRAQSERMKRYWAAKRAQTSPAGVKGRPKSAAEKKALSLKMKQVWAKRRAEAAKKASR
jgi:hypothetical protein